MEEKKEALKLQDEVAAKYQMLKGHGVGEYRFQGHVVHLQHTNLALAEKLVEKGFPYLVEKKAAADKPAAEKPKS